MDKENAVSSRTRVSKQVKVTQGDSIITFELKARGLRIEFCEKGMDTLELTLGKPAVDALKELLNGGLIGYTIPKPATMPLDEVAKRFTRDGDPPAKPDINEDEGLSQGADRIEAGMD